MFFEVFWDKSQLGLV